MSRKRRITKYITIEQMDFLKYLETEEIQVFSIEDTKNFDFQGEITNELFENLTKKNFLTRIERGKYCRANFRNENVIGTFLAKNSAVAYWSALNLHGLTEQFPNKIFIQTTQLKKEVEFAGTTYQFIKIQSNKSIGLAFNGYGNYKYPITDIEKTIVDCFDLPQYSGGFAELIRAFYNAKLNAKKLINYCDAVDNIAIIKRLGFLAELFEKKNLTSFVKFARSKVNRSYNLFDVFGENTGDPNSNWCLRMNLPKENILAIARNRY
jgi:predicted transcriptional regulator of viral defense system